MIKKILYLAFLLLFSFKVGEAQVLTPVKWSYAAKKIDKHSALVLLKATIEPGWHIYSVNQKDGGPLKTTIKFTRNTAFTLVGKITEPSPTERFEKSFDMTVHFFDKEVIFQQRIGLKTHQTTVKGTIEYMACNDEKCLPPETINFNIPVK